VSQIDDGSHETLDPRARRTRRLLVEAFEALMHERGYGRITVGNIASRATVNRATFYLHFRDKDALLEETLRGWTRAALDRAAPVPQSGDPVYLEALLTGVCQLLERLGRECPRSHQQFEVLLENLVRADVRARVAGWLALPGAAPAAPTDTLSATVLGAGIYAAAQAWQRDGARPGAAAFAQSAIPVLLAPLGSSIGARPADRHLRGTPGRTAMGGVRRAAGSQ
jgi:AcrR family transcriptional regulator